MKESWHTSDLATGDDCNSVKMTPESKKESNKKKKQKVEDRTATALVRVCDAAQAEADISSAEVDLGVPEAGAEIDHLVEEEAEPATSSHRQGQARRQRHSDKKPSWAAKMKMRLHTMMTSRIYVTIPKLF